MAFNGGAAPLSLFQFQSNFLNLQPALQPPLSFFNLQACKQLLELSSYGIQLSDITDCSKKDGYRNTVSRTLTNRSADYTTPVTNSPLPSLHPHATIRYDITWKPCDAKKTNTSLLHSEEVHDITSELDMTWQTVSTHTQKNDTALQHREITPVQDIVPELCTDTQSEVSVADLYFTKPSQNAVAANFSSNTAYCIGNFC